MQKAKMLPGLLVAMVLAFASGCGRKSEAEKTRDKIDRKIENVEDAVTHDGPKENAREAKEKAKREIEDRKD